MKMIEILVLLAIGLLAGFLSGLVGIGGGIVIVPVLVYFFSMSQKSAQGTVLFMFLLPIGVLGVYNYYKAGHVDFRIAAVMAITFVLGSYLGSKTAISVDTRLVKQIFAVSIILIGMKMLFGK
jgi:uncharacterized membrane protein YfcA